MGPPSRAEKREKVIQGGVVGEEDEWEKSRNAKKREEPQMEKGPEVRGGDSETGIKPEE